MATQVPTIKTETPLNKINEYPAGENLNVDDAKVAVPQQSFVIKPEFTVWDPNIHNVTGNEASAISRETDYVNPSGDRTNIGNSVSDKKKLDESVKKNVATILGLATSEKGQLVIKTSDGDIPVSVSIQDLKQNNDLYPGYTVSSRPDPTTNLKSFIPYVIDQENFKPLNNEELAYFVQNIAVPAIDASKMDKGVVEYN